MTAHTTPRTKLAGRARYQRRYARHTSVTYRRRHDDGPPPRRPHLMIGQFVQYMQIVVAQMYGAKGKWGHGRFQHATKKGPGRRPIARIARLNPAGSKLVKRFIRDSHGENTTYRKQYLAMTGKAFT